MSRRYQASPGTSCFSFVMSSMARLALIGLVLLLSVAPSAQYRLQPVTELRGKPALELMLRKLDTVGNFMMTTAHPDDENNAMLAYYAHGKGFRASLVTATHGEGGQNEIGPELFEALAVLRTEELLAAHRFDGAEQYFTRAIDFGFSFSVEETLEKWGHQEILGDFVRMIRTIRPDVIVGFVFDGEGGGQHHQTSARLTLEAFRAAADPKAFPEQIEKDGLRPWQAKKYYYTAGFGGMGPGEAAPRVPTFTGEGASRALTFTAGADYDPVLGRTYDEIGGEARSMHKCQGMSQLLPLPNSSARFYRLRDTVLPDGVNRAEDDVFDGVDTSLMSLASYAGSNAPAALVQSLKRITSAVADARSALAQGGSSATVPALTEGLAAVRELRGALPSMGLSDEAQYEIDFRLKPKEEQFARALILAADVRLEALANDGLVVAGQPVQVQAIASRRGGVPVQLKGVKLAGFDGTMTACDAADLPGPNGSKRCAGTLTIPADAKLTAAHFRRGPEGERYVFDPDVPFGLPFRPTPFTATFEMTIGGAAVSTTLPVQFRSDAEIFAGEKRQELHVVPKFAVETTPGIVVVPLAESGRQKDVRVTVVNHSKGAAKAEVELVLPQGWRATPSTAPVAFSREDEQMTVRFSVQPPPGVKAGRTTVRAVVRENGVSYEQGYQRIEYPHTTRRHVLRAPVTTMNALDVRVKPDLVVGYIMGVGDQVPQALEQLGAKVELLGEDDLAWGDLSKYSVIMTGVRAYERRADLRAYNERLLDYARAGGTVIVNYNKFEFNEAQYGPYPGRVGRARVTDENAEVRLLAPGHPVFTAPNTIGRADWMGWVQERGLYFFDTEGRDPRYQDLLEFDEPFEYNRGPKRGALVEAKVGQGRWIYLGLGLWRQLPAGTDGAFRLMANLISLGASSPQTR
jgi:LmbE family N-acetylglucosaminyl deacetylase